MRLLFVLALVSLPLASYATETIGSNEAHVSASALKEVEVATDARFAGDPWQMLGYTRGTYLPGYGAVFTFEMSLVQSTPVTPFHPVVTAQEKKTLHDRKIRQLAVLREVMRDQIVRTASMLAVLPGSENIVFDAHLLSQSYEDISGLPWRLAMTANRKKIQDAVARHASTAEIAGLIEERKE